MNKRQKKKRKKKLFARHLYRKFHKLGEQPPDRFFYKIVRWAYGCRKFKKLQRKFEGRIKT